jgi:dTDP-4-amino-4,6-dideoxygalactose transaminase
MYRIGQEEIDAISEVVHSGKVFRYHSGTQCEQFEERYAAKLGVKHCVQTASGTNSLTAALAALEVGPGDEVLVPACTYMATPIAVLAVGAIPVIVDIDESITISPAAVERNLTDRVKAVIPVHMWGLSCDMDPIMELSRKHGFYVVEDACQAVGGAYKGRMLGSIGHIGAFSFNYFKNMTCGEGGAVVTTDEEWARRIMCAVDPCNFYWNGREEDSAGFTFNGARASEFEGAMLNAQLDRIDEMIGSMRAEKKRILEETADMPLRPIPARSLDWECGTHVMYQLPTAEAAKAFAEAVDGTVTIDTGRHVYTEWDPILAHRGGHHRAMNPYNFAENKGCRMEYSMDMCSSSLELMRRTVYVQTHPDHTAADVDRIVSRIRKAAGHVVVAT